MIDKNQIPNKIESLKSDLYSRNFVQKEISPETISERQNIDVSREWREDEVSKPEQQISSIFANKLLLASSLFFIVAIAVASFIFFGGRHIVSADNITIDVGGPVSVAGGEELSLDVSVTNNNSVGMELVDLIVKFPSGARAASDMSSSLENLRESLGDIDSGKSAEKTLKAVLFGEEGSKQIIKIGVEYRMIGSNGIYYKEKPYEISLTNSPVNMTVRALDEANVGQEVEMIIDIVSNSPTLIENVIVKATYPFGWKFKDASPAPVSGNDIWKIGDVASKSKRTISIRGIIDAENNEERVFRFEIGMGKANEDLAIGVIFLSASKSVLVKKPFLGADLSLDGSGADSFAAKAGRLIRADITWVNNTDTNITDAVIMAKITGNALDKNSVTSNNGFYRSIDNTIIWSKETIKDFESIEPGGRGVLNFNFSSLKDLSSFKNSSEINIEITAEGQRTSDTGVPQKITVTNRNIKIYSDFSFSQRTLHFTGPLLNIGPIPPKVEVYTTYTVVWTIGNSLNDLSNVKISSTLSPNVKWVSEIYPSDGDLSFNSLNNEIVWDVGSVLSGVGSSRQKKEVAFKVGITPSISQVGRDVSLTENTNISGIDNFTGLTIKDIKGGVSTKLLTETQAKESDGVVVK